MEWNRLQEGGGHKSFVSVRRAMLAVYVSVAAAKHGAKSAVIAHYTANSSEEDEATNGLRKKRCSSST